MAPCAKAAAICWSGAKGQRRPDPLQAGHGSTRRWCAGTDLVQPEALTVAKGVFRPDLYDAALGGKAGRDASDAVGAFDGPAFDANDIAGTCAFKIGRRALTKPMEQCWASQPDRLIFRLAAPKLAAVTAAGFQMSSNSLISHNSLSDQDGTQLEVAVQPAVEIPLAYVQDGFPHNEAGRTVLELSRLP